MATTDPIRYPGIGGNSPVAFEKEMVRQEHEEPKYPLGTVVRGWQRTFHYCRATEALTAGKLLTMNPIRFSETTVTVAHPIGTREVTITNGFGNTVDKNELGGGELTVFEGTGAGDSYIILGNTAADDGETMTVTLDSGLTTAWSTSDTDVFVYGSACRAQVANSDQKEMPLGVPRVDVTDEYYFWAQTYGMCPCLPDEAIGNATNERVLTIGSSTAGAVEALDALGETIVGQVISDGTDFTDADYEPIFLQIMP